MQFYGLRPTATFKLGQILMTLLKFIRLTLALACLLLNLVETAEAGDRSPNPSHFTILGLMIGECASQDIYSKLGPGIPFRSKAKADVQQVCYVSDKDETLLVFSLELRQCSRVQLLSQKKKFYKWHFCEKSPLVSEHLAFESGLKLGMRKNRLRTILGTPRSESIEILNYVYEWRQKMSPTKMEDVSKDSRDNGKTTHRKVSAAIRAEFSDTGLISIDVSMISE